MRKAPALTDQVVMEAIAQAASRRILAATMRRPLAVKDISREADVPMASAYRQVNQLASQGLLVVERSALTADGKPYDLYRARVRVARITLDESGVAVTWEANTGLEDRIMNLWDKLGA